MWEGFDINRGGDEWTILNGGRGYNMNRGGGGLVYERGVVKM